MIREYIATFLSTSKILHFFFHCLKVCTFKSKSRGKILLFEFWTLSWKQATGYHFSTIFLYGKSFFHWNVSKTLKYCEVLYKFHMNNAFLFSYILAKAKDTIKFVLIVTWKTLIYEMEFYNLIISLFYQVI